VGVQRPDVGDEVGVGAGVGDGGLDLAAVAHDPRVAEETLDVGGTEAGDHLGVEAGEHLAEGVALAQDGEPRQAGLEALEAQLLEQPVLVVDGPTPLGVVVGEVERVVAGPPAPDGAVGALAQAIGDHHGCLLPRRRAGTVGARAGGVDRRTEGCDPAAPSGGSGLARVRAYGHPGAFVRTPARPAVGRGSPPTDEET
jgi:hypothetical protein